MCKMNSLNQRLKQLSLSLIVCETILALMMSACSSPAATSQQATPTPVSANGEPTPMPLADGLVDVGGHKLRFHCTGQGSPTVILEAGGGGSANTWGMVQSGGERNYRVCSYDRANLGRSGEAPKPRTFQDIARDLHALVVNAYIAGPYILVGHSMGGMLVRVYRDQYPEEVAGLVLVDSAHPEMGPRLLAALPPESLFESKAIKTWRRFLEFQWKSDGRESGNREGPDMQAGNELVKAVKPLGDLPLVVISRSPDSSGFPNMPALPAEISASLSQIWQDMQRELAGLSTHSTRVIADHAGHMIPMEEPGPVIEAIHALVSEVRSRSGETMAPAQPADGTGEAKHTPTILRAAERTENRDGQWRIHHDITFMDAAGDATLVINKVMATSESLNFTISDDIILASADEQKREALVTIPWGCGSVTRPYWIVLEFQILDRAGNTSEPVTFTDTCSATQRPISPFLIIGLVAGLALLVAAAWLLVRYRRARRAATSLA
jgi:pimeloyl-ACP methyl ester carboxylesterase